MRRVARRDGVAVVDKVVWAALREFHGMGYIINYVIESIRMTVIYIRRKLNHPFSIIYFRRRTRSDQIASCEDLIKDVGNFLDMLTGLEIHLTIRARHQLLKLTGLTDPHYQNDTKQLCSTSYRHGRRR
jgi:hypothetical protein